MEAIQDTSHSGFDYRHEGLVCSVWPYVRGHFGRGFLYHLWSLVEAEKDWHSIMWETPESNTPISQKGDLVSFVHYMESFLDPKSILIVQDNHTREIAGFIWFNRQKPDSAYGSIWISKKYRGHVSREAVKLGMEYAFHARGWKSLFAVTPWPVARNLLVKCGWRELAKLPEMYNIDVYMLAVKESDHG